MKREWLRLSLAEAETENPHRVPLLIISTPLQTKDELPSVIEWVTATDDG